ncbi:MAG: Zn-ribbon-containing, possibly RNA-binding protein and truncated derivatives [uncultured Nocardioidaceae bacterium]|uniref:Zn-ribbon-containing, possibly RNA-binding protein and truncated derivatives n=1 Tax=uncultured Nocardioidaceae bacterium TaxID=253824 RepID=A0A6J4MLZ4_9ACTN|nr:MAG: Zn-ribbon-containing, possibly RNA-binding protein and truncated derivatives [uncultured Nocardioidaceae bacterium]
MTGPDEPGTEPRGAQSRGAQSTGAQPDDHEESGLDLARSVARSLARGPKAVRRSGRRARTDPKSSGSHPDDRDPQTLDATLGRLVAEQGWGSDVRVHGVFSRWDAMVGRDVAQHVRPVSYVREDGDGQVGGRLVVQTDSTAWATQMRLLAPTVVRRLNEELGDGTVRVIDVQGPNVPSWKRGRRSVRDGRGPRDTYG